MNTDYRTLIKALANRLPKVLPKLINPGQVGYKRVGTLDRIVELLTIFKILLLSQNFQAIVYIVDFEKVFDSVEWSFLTECLKSYIILEVILSNGQKYFTTIFNPVLEIMVSFPAILV